jgi:ribosome-binding ATPase YchF (GTP1/OBG family)
MRKSRDYKNEYKISLSCFVAMIISVVAYLYFLNISVIHVVMRQDALQDIKTLQTEIAVLESSYIEAQHTIASRIAVLDDYSTETDKIFVSRDSVGLVLGNR